MKKICAIMLILCSLLIGCGKSQVDVEAIGQVKKISNVTPLLFPDYTYADISLGIMRNGVGSMSTEDIWIVVKDYEQVRLLKSAAETGALVKIVYDKVRLGISYPELRASSVEMIWQ